MQIAFSNSVDLDHRPLAMTFDPGLHFTDLKSIFLLYVNNVVNNVDPDEIQIYIGKLGLQGGNLGYFRDQLLEVRPLYPANVWSSSKHSSPNSST